MRPFDEAQLAFWCEREKEERGLAAQRHGEESDVHLKLADSYAQLILQVTGTPSEIANEMPPHASPSRDI